MHTVRSREPASPGSAELARNLVNLEDVRKGYGTRTLLDGVSLGLGEGDRVGVVGRNGGGKSTLLRMLARHEAPDEGRVTHSGGLRVATVAQREELDATTTVRELVVGGGPAHAWASDAGVREVLGGLFGAAGAGGALDAMLERSAGALSGGERRRVSLAQALIVRLAQGLLHTAQSLLLRAVGILEFFGEQLAYFRLHKRSPGLLFRPYESGAESGHHPPGD